MYKMITSSIKKSFTR